MLISYFLVSIECILQFSFRTHTLSKKLNLFERGAFENDTFLFILVLEFLLHRFFMFFFSIQKSVDVFKMCLCHVRIFLFIRIHLFFSSKIFCGLLFKKRKTAIALFIYSVNFVIFFSFFKRVLLSKSHAIFSSVLSLTS